MQNLQQRVGWVLSGGVALGLGASAAMKLHPSAEMLAAFAGTFGYPLSTLQPLGCVELACTLLYLVPRTQVLGAVLLTGYLGGAVATHVRIGEAPLAPLVLGGVVWLGLWLRLATLRRLLPLRAAG